MNSKTRKAIAAWKQAMQQDLDRLNKLGEEDKWLSEEANRIRDCLNKAITLLGKRHGIYTSFSQGKRVVIQKADRLGHLVTV